MIENVDYEISKKVFAIFGFPARILRVSCENSIPIGNLAEFHVGMKLTNCANFQNE
jgi:hypothetical protein